VAIPAQGIVGIPDVAIPATQKEFDRANEAFKKDRNAFRSMYPTKGQPVSSFDEGIDPNKIASISIVKNDADKPDYKPLVENNPIDLE
jgi:hypothetical protein